VFGTSERNMFHNYAFKENLNLCSICYKIRCSSEIYWKTPFYIVIKLSGIALSHWVH